MVAICGLVVVLLVTVPVFKSHANPFLDSGATTFSGTDPMDSTYVTNTITGVTTVNTNASNGNQNAPAGTYTPFSGFGSALLNRFQGLGNSSSLSDFLNALFALIVSIGSVLAVVMIMYEGYSYFASTRDGRVVAAAETKQKIIKIVLGFLLLLCIYTILRTINPDLLNLGSNVNLASLTPDQVLALTFSGFNTSDPSTPLTQDQLNQAISKYSNDQQYIASVYVPARDAQLPTITRGMKCLITAHATMEGFYPGSVSYTTNNPGNIGNYAVAGQPPHRNPFPTLGQGIQAQFNYETRVASGTQQPYVIGNSGYDGTLGKYFNIYESGSVSPSASGTNYMNFVQQYCAAQGITGISSQTTVAQMIAIQ